MNFPPRELAEQDYTVDPWTDEFGQQWVYTVYEDDILKNRWNAVPSATTGGGTSGGGGLVASLAPPPDPYPGMQWFRLVDGVTYVREQSNRFWVADTSAPIPALDDLWAELDTKLSAATTVVEIADSASTTTLSPSHANAYLYFTGSGSKTYDIPNGETSPVGTTITLNNLAGVLTITHGVNITLVLPPDVGWDELDPYEMAQLLKVGENTWHLL